MRDREMVGDDGLVWHYSDGAGLKSIIVNRVLWASSAAYMNDFKELISGNDVLNKTYARLKEEVSENHREELQQAVTSFSSPREEKFILSASSDPDSLTLWRYYGRDRVSFAVGLDRSVLLEARAQTQRRSHPYPPPGYLNGYRDEHGTLEEDPDTVGQIVEPWDKMIYEPHEQETIIRRALSNLDEALRDARTDSRVPFRVYTKNLALQSRLNRIKDSGFRDERELRILAQVSPHWKYVLHRPGRFGLVPYIEIGMPVGGSMPSSNSFRAGGPQKMKRLPIRQINIGPTPFPEEARFGLKQLLNFKGYHDVTVVVSKIPYR